MQFPLALPTLILLFFAVSALTGPTEMRATAHDYYQW